jgi:hypothetical protein
LHRGLARPQVKVLATNARVESPDASIGDERRKVSRRCALKRIAACCGAVAGAGFAGHPIAGPEDGYLDFPGGTRGYVSGYGSFRYTSSYVSVYAPYSSGYGSIYTPYASAYLDYSSGG